MRTVLSLECMLLVELAEHCSTGKCTAFRLKHSPETYVLQSFKPDKRHEPSNFNEVHCDASGMYLR